MPETAPVVRQIAWREVFPWLMLTRVFRQSLRLRALVIALAALLLTVAGWNVCGWMFSGSRDLQAPDGSPDELVRLFTAWPWEDLGAPPSASAGFFDEIAPPHWSQLRPVGQLLAFRRLFEFETSVSVTAFLLLCGVWALAVWSFAGGAIARIAAMAIAKREQISLGQALDFARRKWVSYFSAPLMPLVGVLFVALFMALFALLMRFDIGLFLVSAVWILWLIGGLILALLIIGLAVSWPLMWATISCEGTDAFDAIGRSYGYLFGRPLNYLFYGAISVFLGWLGWIVVELFANAVILHAAWAASWGSGGERMGTLLDRPEELEGTVAQWGAAMFWFWNGCVRILPMAMIQSFFWTASTAVYLLLRQDEDQTDLDELYVEDEQPPLGLPPLKTDAAGVPEPADMPAAPAAAAPPELAVGDGPDAE